LTHISPQFRKLFEELEKGYLEKREILNSRPEKEKSLVALLIHELSQIESWRRPIMEHLWAIDRKLSHEERIKYEEFVRQSMFRRVLHDETPFYRRIIDKPEGYAGDAEVLRMLYDNSFEGDTPFGMFAHKQVTGCLTAQAIRNRRDFLREHIRQVKEKGKGRVLSIAAGHAMEIRDILAEDRSGNTLQFHAFDHDIKTIRTVCRQCVDPRLSYFLGNAFHLIKGSYSVAVPRKFLLNYCNPRKDFKGIRKVLLPLKYGAMKLKRNDYALVYSAGLYDYIHTFKDDPTKGTISLTKHLFELVQPDGSLIIGNFSPDTPSDLRFMLDYVCEWKLIYRTKEDLFDFARGIPPSQIKNMEVLLEPLGINYFLKIDKK
jgi:extracellular factor (EF) 3-hydroxypalmitic acid methyl ester biosynthesis protein